MTRYKYIAHILFVLSFLLSYPPVAVSQEVYPVTYRAEFIPLGKGLTRKATFPSGGGALGLEFELVLSPGTVTAEVSGEIHFDADNETLQVRGTSGHLSSDGGIILKGDIAMDFIIPLPEAFFEEDDSVRINRKVPIPGFPRIEKGWNESKTFNSLLLRDSHPENAKLDIGNLNLVTIHLSAVEIVPVVTSAILSGGTLTAAVKIIVDNISDYLDTGISLNGGIASELTLAGKAVTVNGTPVTSAGQLVRAPGLDPAQETYQIQSNYDETFTYSLDFVASSNAYAKVVLLGALEIWSYDKPFAENRISIIDENTFDLNFGGAATSATIDVLTESSDQSDGGPGVIPDPVLASAIRGALNIRSNPKSSITPNDMLKLTELSPARGVRNLTGMEHAINLRELGLYGSNISDVSPLSGLKNLEKLALYGNNISKVSLSDMPNLKELNIGNNPLSKVSLSGMLNLEALNLSGNAFSEVSLSNMPNLTRLSFGNSTISELSLSGLTNLPELSLRSRNMMSKLSVSGLTNLKRLHSHDYLSEISLSDIPNLEYLGLANNSLSEVSLPNMPKLKTLDLANNTLSEVSLPNMPNLTRLFLSDNTLSEVSLPNMPKLEYLELANNSLSEVSLPNMPKLKLLRLSNNTLSEVSLPSMPNLENLSLANNTLSEVSLPSMPNLENLSLANNSLSEVSLPSMPKLERLGLTNNMLSEVSLPDVPNLKSLSLANNSLSEVFLSDMPNLENLYLGNNSLSKVSVSDMPKLEYLGASPNSTSEVSLSNLPNLRDEYSWGNTISKLSLSGITNLTELHLHDRTISEISLSDMPNLKRLTLYGNSISDVSGLLDIENLEFLDLTKNPLNYASRSTHIPAMQARGMNVLFDPRESPILVKISGEDQSGAPSLALPTPFVVQASDVEDKPMVGVPIRFAVYQGRGTLSTTSTTTDTTGKARTTLTLGPEPGANKVAVIAEGFEAPVSFTATAILDVVTPMRIAEDVNGDGVVNIQDLVLVSSNLGEVGENEADVNGDGTVNIQDLVQVSTALQ